MGTSAHALRSARERGHERRERGPRTVSERFAEPYGISMGRATMTPLCVRTLAT